MSHITTLSAAHYVAKEKRAGPRCADASPSSERQHITCVATYSGYTRKGIMLTTRTQTRLLREALDTIESEQLLSE